MTDQLDKSSLIDFRDAMKDDTAFIFSTWLRGLKFGNSWYRLINAKVYYYVYHKIIEAIIAKPTTFVKIACLKEDPSVILGYSVYEKDRLHWVHVKKAWRNIGLAKDLVPQDIKVVSHLTDVGKIIFLKKNLDFNPFALI